MYSRFFLILLVFTFMTACGGSENTNPDADGDADSDADAPTDADGQPDSDDMNDSDNEEDTHPDADAIECGEGPFTRVIANWDVVPFQLIDGTFSVGVIAFHETGANVRFDVNGTEVATVTAPTLNARTDVYEYWFEFDASDYPDGAVVISATAIPDDPCHLSRELDDLTLYANSNATMVDNNVAYVNCETGDDSTGNGSDGQPYRTIQMAFGEVGDGGTVYLQPGTCYSMEGGSSSGTDYQYWTTITVAPGSTRDDVEIQGGNFRHNMVRWQNVQIARDAKDGASYDPIVTFSGASHVWLDGVEAFHRQGHHGPGVLVNSQGALYYMTDCLVRDINGAGGWFSRNVTIRNNGADVWRGENGLLAVNIHIDNMDPAPKAHQDVLQFYNPDRTIENVILYNVLVTQMNCQGWFGGPARDVAIVNMVYEKLIENPLISQIGEWDHGLFWHVTTYGSSVLVREPETLTNFSMHNNIFQGFHTAEHTALPNSAVSHNHYTTLNWNQPDPLGTNATYDEDPQFTDVDSRDGSFDYSPQPTSPAYRAGIPLECVPADINGVPFHSTTPNLGAYSSQ